jgi:hypothetical protein
MRLFPPLLSGVLPRLSVFSPARLFGVLPLLFGGMLPELPDSDDPFSQTAVLLSVPGSLWSSYSS